MELKWCQFIAQMGYKAKDMKMTIRQRPEALARRVLEAHWDGVLPVDIRGLAESCGARVIDDPLLDVSGVVAIEGGEPVIKVNTNESELRQRFTIAHELGHMMLRHLTKDKTEFRDPSKNYTMANFDRRERDANRFAAAILMPGEAVRAVILEMDDADVDSLASVFKVSKAAMSIKLKSMGILPEWA